MMNPVFLSRPDLMDPFSTANSPGTTNFPGAKNSPDAVHASNTASGVRKPSEPESIHAAGQRDRVPANTDRYTPGEKPDPVGLYWPGTDENGRPMICQDAPQQGPVSTALPKEQPGTDTPGRAACADEPEDPNRSEKNTPQSPEKAVRDAGEERCTVNTDRVDREIEKLKQERQELEQQLRSETDEAKRQTAQQRLEQVERELNQKDNDAYRRQNAVYTYF